MKLVSLNIELNKHRDTVLNFLKKESPDVICLQELLESDFERFKNELGVEGIFKVRKYVNHPKYMDAAGMGEGVAIFTKKISDSGFIYYSGKEEYISDEENEKRAVLVWVKITDMQNKAYIFVTTHLPATKKGSTTPLQIEIVDQLIAQLDTLGEFVLCGDMNAPRGKEAFDRLAKKYRDNIPLEYKTSLDQNLHRVKGLQYMVDGLFTTPIYKASTVKLVAGISDHLAIVAEIE